MNRFLTILIVIVAVAGALGVGALFLLRPSAPVSAPTTQSGNSLPSNNSTVSVSSSNADQLAVQAAYQQVLSKDNFDNVKLYQTVVSGKYALQVWKGDHVGGEALLVFTAQHGWAIIDPGGGEWSVEGLIQMGVPTSTAQALLAGVPR